MISTATRTSRRFGNATRHAARLHGSSAALGASSSAVLSVDRWLTDYVLGAETADEVSARVEEMAVNPELYQRLAALPLKDGVLSEDLDTKRWNALLQRFGGAPSLMQGIRDYHIISVCFTPPLEELSSTTLSDLDGDPAWFAYDPTIPPEVSAAVLDGMCGSVAFMVMEFIALTDRPVAWWVRDALVSAWVPAQHHFLRCLASLPGNPVPEYAVPRAERFDLATVQEETSAFNAWTSDVLSTAAARRTASPSS
jgi:hypothetical protein